MELIIMLLVVLMFILYIYGSIEAKFGTKTEQYVKIKYVINTMIFIVALIKSSWTLFLIAIIFLISSVVPANKRK